ncbi:MAG: methyltransferase domain-containing protein [Anaerolineae bacterium]|nr:methyltransferase domain-containing protein [Anaerolineae bacterium]
MPDVYATIGEARSEVQEHLAEVIEKRFTDPRQRAMLDAFLAEIAFPAAAAVLEIGCGTGYVTRLLASMPHVAQVVGVDPSPVFIAQARARSQGIPKLSFEEGDGRSLTVATAAFDVVVIYTTISHVPQPERLIAEAFRVLRPQGWIAIFDGDYATGTVGVGDTDPLEVCVQAFRENFVNDPRGIRRLPQLLARAGFLRRCAITDMSKRQKVPIC